MGVFRILHTEASCGWGGQELRILAELSGMARRGHRLWLAAPQGSPIAAAALAAGVPLIPVPFRRPLGAAADLAALRRACLTHGIELVNTHSSWDSWLASAAARLTRGGAGVVRTRHLSTPVAATAVSRLLYTRLTDHVVTTGEAIREELIRRNGFPPDRISSVVTGIDPAALAPGRPPAVVRAECGLPTDRPVIGMVSTIRSWKGHLDLLDALTLLRRSRDVRALIVGDGPSAPVVRARVAALHLEGAVIFTGQRQEVAELMRAMDVVAQPSYANEGVPQAVLQAMALGRPVVGSALGGIPEVVRDGETGLLVPPRDAERLAAALARVLDDPDAAAARAARAEALVRGRYTLEAMLDRMEGVYRTVRERSAGRRAPSVES
jgi:glycosyltransferase involved in cell wall biosynthesis